MPNMTYSDSAHSIRTNAWFRSRVDVALSGYTNYLLNTPSTDADHAAKTAYGTRIAQMSTTVVDTLMFTLSGDAEVLTGGPAIPDTQLQSIVEKTVTKVFPMPPAPTEPATAGMQFPTGPLPQHLAPKPQ